MFSPYIAILRFSRAVIRVLKDSEYKRLLIFVVIILFIGTTFYNRVEKLNILDSMYLSVTTLMTVGYGDFVPKTAAGKIFTIIYLFTGVGVILGFINAVAHHAGPQGIIKRFIKSKKEKDKL